MESPDNNPPSRVLILGGYGRAGRDTARLLCEHIQGEVVLAGRDGARAEAAAARLRGACPEARVSGASIDLAQAGGLAERLAEYDLVLGCAPLRDYMPGVMHAVAAAGVDYMDIAPHREKQAVLREHTAAATARGQYIVIDGGFVPGLPGWLARRAAAELDETHRIEIGIVAKDNTLPYVGAYDMFVYIGAHPQWYEDGAWRPAPLLASRKFAFPPPFGAHRCFPGSLPELQNIPDETGCTHLTYVEGGLNPLAIACLLRRN